MFCKEIPTQLSRCKSAKDLNSLSVKAQAATDHSCKPTGPQGKADNPKPGRRRLEDYYAPSLNEGGETHPTDGFLGIKRLQISKLPTESSARPVLGKQGRKNIFLKLPKILSKQT